MIDRLFVSSDFMILISQSGRISLNYFSSTVLITLKFFISCWLRESEKRLNLNYLELTRSFCAHSCCIADPLILARWLIRICPTTFYCVLSQNLKRWTLHSWRINVKIKYFFFIFFCAILCIYIFVNIFIFCT